MLKLTDQEFLKQLVKDDEMLPCFEINCDECKNGNYHEQLFKNIAHDPTMHRKCFDNYMDMMKVERLQEILK